MGKPYSNGMSLSISTIFGTILSWLFLVLPLLSKRPITNESEGGNRESREGGWEVGKGRPINMSLPFPFLSLLLYYFFLI
jgi:hypothetical protein